MGGRGQSCHVQSAGRLTVAQPQTHRQAQLLSIPEVQPRHQLRPSSECCFLDTSGAAACPRDVIPLSECVIGIVHVSTNEFACYHSPKRGHWWGYREPMLREGRETPSSGLLQAPRKSRWGSVPYRWCIVCCRSEAERCNMVTATLITPGLMTSGTSCGESNLSCFPNPFVEMTSSKVAHVSVNEDSRLRPCPTFPNKKSHDTIFFQVSGKIRREKFHFGLYFDGNVSASSGVVPKFKKGMAATRGDKG